MKYLKFFFILFFTFSVNAKTLKLPEVVSEYVCNTKFIMGATVLETRTFQGKNKKRIDTMVDNVPQSVIIDYEKQTAIYVWPKTFSYLTIKLNPETQKKLKKISKITYLEKIKSDWIHGFEVDIFKIKRELLDGTFEESTRWITKHGITLREKGIIEGKEGKIQFLSEFSNVRVFKQDQRVFEIPEGYTIAPMGQLDDVNKLLKLMVKRI